MPAASGRRQGSREDAFTSASVRPVALVNASSLDPWGAKRPQAQQEPLRFSAISAIGFRLMGEPAGVAWVETHRQEADPESRIPGPDFSRSRSAATCVSVSAMLPFVSIT